MQFLSNICMVELKIVFYNFLWRTSNDWAILHLVLVETSYVLMSYLHLATKLVFLSKNIQKLLYKFKNKTIIFFYTKKITKKQQNT